MSRSVDLFVLAHILAALWLAGGAFAGAVVRAATRRATTLAEQVFALRLGWRLLTLFGIPGSVIAGAIGLHLVTARGFGWQAGWVHASVGLWALATAAMLLVTAPRLRRTLAAAERSLAQGKPDAEYAALTAARWPGHVADFSALAVVLLTLLMVLKPF